MASIRIPAAVTVADEGTNLPGRPRLDFVGDGVTVTDRAADNTTEVAIPGGEAEVLAALSESPATKNMGGGQITNFSALALTGGRLAGVEAIERAIPGEVVAASTAAIGTRGSLTVGPFTLRTKQRGRDGDTLVRVTVDAGDAGADQAEDVVGAEGGGYRDVTITLERTGYAPPVPGTKTIAGLDFENTDPVETVSVTVSRNDGYSGPGGAFVGVIGSSGVGDVLTSVHVRYNQSGLGHPATAEEINDAILRDAANANLRCVAGVGDRTNGGSATDIVPTSSGGGTPSEISSTRESIEALIALDAIAADALESPISGGLASDEWTTGCAQTQLTGGADVEGGAPDTLDGVTLEADDVVLLKDADFARRNGPYRVVDPGTGVDGEWTRAEGYTAATDLARNKKFRVLGGATNADRVYRIETPPATIDVDPVAIEEAW